ncbi:MAG TPA: hypothetical protein VM101_10545 [Flavitalea sp.]|nr:hypothetical protein [Flavitalea sp.]
MKQGSIFLKIYLGAALPVAGILFFICLMLGYDSHMILFELLTSLLLALPAIASVFFSLLLIRMLQLNKIAGWMLIFTILPIVSILPALQLSEAVPGDIILITSLSTASGYAGILSNGISISELFNSYSYETK